MKFPAIKPILFRKKTSITALSGNLPEKKFKHLVFGSLFLLVAMFGSGYYLLLKLSQSDAARNIIVSQIEQATGREVSFEGDIDLALSWKPTFKINGVTLANVEGAKAPYFLSIEKLLFTLDLLPLLQRQISVTALELERPIVYLEKKEAAVNWKFEPQNQTNTRQERQLKKERSNSKPLAVSLQKISLQNGELHYRDLVTEQKQELRLTSMEFANHSIQGKSAVDLQGYYQNTPFLASLKADSLKSLVQQSGDMALTLNLDLGNNTLEADGVFSWQEADEVNASPVRLGRGTVDKPAKQMTFTGSVQGLLSDLDAIAKVSGVQIPEMEDVNFSGVGTFSPQAIQADKLSLKSKEFQLEGNAALSLGDKDLNKIWTNVVLAGSISDLAFLKPFWGENNIPIAPGQTTFTLKAGTEQDHLKFSELNIESSNLSLQANNLTTRLPHNNSPLEINGRISLRSRNLGSLVKDPGYAERALKLNGVLAINEKDITLEDLVLSTSNSQIMGRAGVTLPVNKDNVPSIRFDLTAPKILVADLLPEKKPRVTPKNINNKLFSDAPLNLAALSKVNGQGKLSIGSLHLPVADDQNTLLIFNKFETSLSSQNGNLQFDNLAFDLPGSGSVSGTVALNGNGKTAALSTDLRVSKLILGKSLQHFRVTDLMEQGSLDLNLKLNTSGNSMSALAASANGLVDVNMTTARLANINLEQIDNELATNLISLASNNQATTVNCLVSRWSITNGIATTDLTVIDTTHVAMQGTGSIDLGQETLDIIIAPRPKNLGQLNVSAPIAINGSLKKPIISSNLDRVADNLINDLVRGELNPQAIIGTFVDADGNYQTCGAPTKQNANSETTIKNETVPKLLEKKQELESQGRKLFEDAFELLPGWQK